ncbi:MAG: hypothetical protein AAF560_19185 [Acidobacteriota bacterium]
MTRFSKMAVAAMMCGLVALMLPVAADAQSEGVTTIDDEYLDIARAYPGFGGLFYDEEGIANIYVTSDASRSAIQAVAEGEVNFLPADYNWAELFEVRDRVVEVLNDPGVVYLDIDERTNRVTIGISEISGGLQSTKPQASIAARFGVPEGALAIVEAEPVQPMVSLRNQRRPMPAGMQLEFGGFACTLGFVIRQGSTRGFVTNSHCTNRQGGTEGTQYRQGGGSVIASEIKDPNYSRISGCPGGRVCRRSDSSMARFSGNNGGLGQFARIARPTCRNCNNLTIRNNGNARFRITASGNDSGTLHKVGRTTGWTSGPKVGTCQTTNVAQSNITLICQDRVRAGVGSGDSGSPVFKRTGGNRVKVVGVLWGGGGGDFVYSPINQVRQELGNFSVN